ncbi:MAG: FAD-dependent oxidoreductase [Verrucomicrobia bacterium]|nr:FAD-dependent oxidoreductase [Verrucomicrobiota bacterium]MBU4365852.1 FAD-dependent oxidoreductase [Verrucomicrobiota bacterium]
MTTKSNKPIRRVLVLGGGIAGATAAERLGRAGLDVQWVEKEPVIGGHAVTMGCKAADVCLRCHVCVATDRLKAALRAPRVCLNTRSELVALAPGNNGSAYRATLRTAPNFLCRERCIGCGICVAVCPEHCISIKNPALYGGVPVLDLPLCRRTLGKSCNLCAKACPVKAIDWKEQEQTQELDVDAVIVATGHEPFNPGQMGTFGYGVIPNVISGLDAERQLADQHRITRLSDGSAPRRVAFIQCVGSRSEHAHRRPEDTNYCSTVCCSYALRIARRMQHDIPETAVTVFYMDIQNFGKDFQSFYAACQKTMTFVRARPVDITAGNESAVVIAYEEQEKGAVTTAEFDLVVLSIGIRPAPAARALADNLRLAVNEQGFLGIKGVAGLPQTHRENVFIAGTCGNPQDIAATIGQAEAVCAEILGQA